MVALDRQGGPYASRLWWMLRWMGHEAVAVLDGGFAVRRTAGGAVDDNAEPAAHAVGPLPPRAPLVGTLSAEALLAQLGWCPLVDARPGERFRGEVEPLDAKAGHIPGALNRFFMRQPGADGRFKSAKPARRVQFCRPRRGSADGAPVRLGRHRLPQPAGDGARRPRRLAPLSRLVERVVVRPCRPIATG